MSVDAAGFDRAYYLATNADVAAAGVDPWTHYQQYGWREGRNPNSLFDVKFYLSTYSDVAASGRDPLTHYMQYGWRESRDAGPAFSTSAYLDKYADVRATGANPLVHFINDGMREGRTLGYLGNEAVREGFDRGYYLATNPDVAAAGTDPWTHYQQYGWREGRNPNGFFDVKFYLTTYRDVAASGTDPLTHYMQYGWRENRDASPAFSTSAYLFKYADVRAAGINPLTHFINDGMREGRTLEYFGNEAIQEGFDRAFYLSKNADVAATGVDPYAHYQAWGNREGRAPNALFDKAWYLARYTDVAATGVDPLTHYLTYGWREGRDPSASFSTERYFVATGLARTTNPLIYYLSFERYQALGNFGFQGELPQIVQARTDGNAQFVFGGATRFDIGSQFIRVTSPGSPLDGRDLFGYDSFLFTGSAADFTITGSGRFPRYAQLGPGNDSVFGNFDLGGQIANFVPGGGTLTINASFNNGFFAPQGASISSNIDIRGAATVSFLGRGGDDTIRSGGADDTLTLGNGINFADGRGGNDFLYWSHAVLADMATGRASSRFAAMFEDTFLNIENLGGSPYDDVLLGNGGNNRLSGSSVSPGTSGNDILVGRGGDDLLEGGAENDVLIGGSGGDRMFGGDGNDILIDGADGFDAAQFGPMADGGAGNDIFVYFLGSVGEIGRGNRAEGGEGADRYIIDPSRGSWGSLAVRLSQIDGDKIDLSLLRNPDNSVITLADVRAAATENLVFGVTNLLIDLGRFEDAAGNALAGRLNILGGGAAGIGLGTLTEADFIFSGGTPWQTLLPVAVLPDYLI